MNWKTIIALVLLVLIMSTMAHADAVKVYFDGIEVQFSDDLGYPFIDENSRTQVPFRATLEKYGAAVSWNKEDRTAIAYKDGITVSVPIGEKYILRNDIKIVTDTAALIKRDRTYLPIRAVIEAFGSTVEWEMDSRSVLLKSKLKVHFIDVGQADSIFIDYGNYEMLIDGGYEKNGSSVVDFIKGKVDGELDLVIATHMHEDHIGGLIDVLSSYKVSRIIDSGMTNDTKVYVDYKNARDGEQAVYSSDEDMVINVDDRLTIKILEPGDNYSNRNDNSVVAKVIFEDVSFLLTGDIEAVAESKLLNADLSSTVLKAAHHGSSSSSSVGFLEKVKPEYAVISAGENNSGDHPSADVVKRLCGFTEFVYGTKESGSITAETDGKTIIFSATGELESICIQE